MALQFLRDFRRHGIHLTDDARQRLVDLSDRMLVLGRAFFAGTTHASDFLSLTRSEASVLGAHFAQHLHFDSGGKALVDPMDWQGFTLLRQHPHEAVRRRVWIAQNQGNEDQIDLLDTLLRTRHEFARLTDKANWAEVALEDKMAGTPENVMTFLGQLSTKTRPGALAELSVLQRAKQQHLSASALPAVFPWDRDYYANILSRTERSATSATLAPYFSVGTCIQGLSRLFTQIYGISFLVESHSPQEVWHESVVKIAVMDDSEGRIGTIYCDLFDRDGKPSGAAHYTVLCSRRTDLDDEQVDFEFMGSEGQVLIDDVRLSRQDCELLDVPVSARRNRTGTYQKPMVVFSCSFEAPEQKTGLPSLLSWSDVETLFHEMGHAMHCKFIIIFQRAPH